MSKQIEWNFDSIVFIILGMIAFIAVIIDDILLVIVSLWAMTMLMLSKIEGRIINKKDGRKRK